MSDELDCLVDVEVEEDLVDILESVEPQQKEFVYERLSASMMKTWLLCKRKFYENYVLHKKSPPLGVFSLGLGVHYALEMANRLLKEEPRELNPLEIEEYVQIFRDTIAKAHVPDITLFSSGEEMVRQELFNNNYKEQILGIECKFDVVTPEGVRLYGFMDKVVEVDPATIKIIDYKTSKMPLSYEDARHDEQLSMYDLVASMLYPQYEKVILELRYVRSQTVVASYRSEVERHNFRKQLLSVDKAIREFLTTTKDSPEGEINTFCEYCSYKNSCPKYVTLVNSYLPESPTTHALTDETFIDCWEKVSSILKAAEAWKDALKIWAAQRMEEDPETDITNGKKRVYTLSTTRRDPDAAKIGKIIGLKDLLGESTGGVPLVKISNKNLEAYLKIKNDRKLREKVEQATEVKINSPQIRLKKA